MAEGEVRRRLRPVAVLDEYGNPVYDDSRSYPARPLIDPHKQYLRKEILADIGTSLAELKDIKGGGIESNPISVPEIKPLDNVKLKLTPDKVLNPISTPDKVSNAIPAVIDTLITPISDNPIDNKTNTTKPKVKRRMNDEINSGGYITQEQLERREWRRKVDDMLAKNKADVDSKLSSIVAKQEETCKGLDCLKDFGERIKKIEKNTDDQCKGMDCLKDINTKLETYTCDNCGEDKLHPLDYYCPGCGHPVEKWSDDKGLPVKGWKSKKAKN